MNIFRLLGDLAHVASKCILIWSIHKNKSAEGISFLTQVMYALVFVTRYLDLYFRFISIYNTVMKIFYIASACYVLVVMRCFYPHSRESRTAWHTTFIILGLSVLASLIFNYRFTPIEILWSFSIVLEAFCVIPQLILLRETTTPTVITSYYLLALGSYRALYIPNWIYRYLLDSVLDPIAVVFGVIQTAFYLDFAWVYYARQRIKLRDGVLLDSEDYKRGWITRWLSAKADASLQPSLNSGSAVLPDEGALEEGRITLPTEEAEEGRIALPPDAEMPEGAQEGRIALPAEEAEEGRIALPPDAEMPEGALEGRIALPTEEGRVALPAEEERTASPSDAEIPEVALEEGRIALPAEEGRIASPPDAETPARAPADNASAETNRDFLFTSILYNLELHRTLFSAHPAQV
ncbi:Protein-ER retention receptor [Mycena sanguinolenta]|uniref:Protein-ER retention receptor n=1 Tax=Mycena sanguinolenta TaxID=230812 RepID=A0A8H6X5L7_9AGAR|nr:Protein-ER retention receptor [Mycena sanguinolenta]